MIRRSTLGWTIGAAVVVVAGVVVAVTAAAHPSHTSAAPDPSSSTTAAPASTPTAAASAASGSPSGSSGPTGATATAPESSTPARPSSAPSPSATSQAAPVRTVSPAVSYYALAGQTLTLGGGVSGLVDSSGTCTVTATSGSAVVTQSFTATAGPSSTDCGAMSLTSPKLHTGQWTLTLDYSSPRAKGVSTPEKVTL